jgi:hypothetical protein
MIEQKTKLMPKLFRMSPRQITELEDIGVLSILERDFPSAGHVRCYVCDYHVIIIASTYAGFELFITILHELIHHFIEIFKLPEKFDKILDGKVGV